MPYQPDLYDLMFPAGLAGDLEWYRGKANELGGPVLELGAGTGRITLPIARDGIPIHALDASPDMLARLRRKLDEEPADVRSRVTVVEGDMRRFQLPERFALVIAPFRAFLHNLTDEDRLACARRVREHLRPGGCFAFNVFHPSLEFMAQHMGPLKGTWRLMSTYDRPDGGFVVRSENTRFDGVRHVLHAQLRFEEYGADGVLGRTSLQRLEIAYLFPDEIRWMLERAGFRSVEIHGGFEGRPVERETDELVVEARVE
jgi:SAM-dependent methyltransferase